MKITWYWPTETAPLNQASFLLKGRFYCSDYYVFNRYCVVRDASVQELRKFAAWVNKELT